VILAAPSAPGQNARMPRLERQYADLSKPIREFTFTVDRLEVEVRFDTLLRAHYPWRSRTHFRGMLRRGEVLVNGEPAKPSLRSRRGDVVVVRLPEDPSLPAQESAEDLVVLYEDDHVVAIDKPSGMAAHPVGRLRHGTLINKLHARYRHPDPALDVVPRLAHRLDQDTSGVVLAVKNRRADASVTDTFTARDVEKTYLALVQGVPDRPEGRIDAPLGDDPDGESALHQAVRADGLPSSTMWSVRRTFARHALLEVRPLTGRTHQIRVHLAHVGHPIVADHLYGDVRPLFRSHAVAGLPPAEDAACLRRLGLHAHRLVLPHPVTGARLELESPLPADMVQALDELARLVRAVRTRA
jgi:23S rRNA pseudouridine1911/1915/1917 synthase